MSRWGARKARVVLRALEKIGWQVKRQSGSHKVLGREGWQDVVFAFHDGEEIGPKMLPRSNQLVALHTKGHALRGSLKAA